MNQTELKDLYANHLPFPPFRLSVTHGSAQYSHGKSHNHSVRRTLQNQPRQLTWLVGWHRRIYHWLGWWCHVRVRQEDWRGRPESF